MFYLIDGYNLLHAMGVLHGRVGPAGLEKARGRLLGLLRGAYAEDEHDRVTVIFDAAKAPRGADSEQEYHGIHVRFAVGEYEADDVIEELIRKASAPKQLAVVSDDHRLHDAARRRRCAVMSCDEYLTWLERHRRQRIHPPEDPAVAKPEGLSRSETQHWLHEFADLETDPAMKELFDPFDFEKEGK
jgi:predicted RNA-binding protein with PIN domain